MPLTLLLDRPKQALPRVVVPFQDETIESYEERLANANHVTTGHLRAHVGKRYDRWPDVDDLAALTNLPRRTLLLALPELRAAHPDPSLPPAGRTFGVPHHPYFRPACRRCVATRGIIGTVQRVATNDNNVCLRHNLWIGARANHIDDQVDVNTLPDVIAAQRWHDNLTRRYGRLRTRDAYDDAAHITLRWTEQGCWSDARIARLDALTGHLNLGVRSGDPLLRLVNYPETVGLTSILLSSYWLGLVVEAVPLHLSPEGRRFVAEVRRRTGITEYEFGGTRDPLDQWCERHKWAARLDRRWSDRRTWADQHGPRRVRQADSTEGTGT